MRKLLYALALILVCAINAYGQGAYSETILGPQVQVRPGAQITVCTHGSNVANCVANKITLYTDVTLITPTTNPVTADGNGRFLVYGPSGTFDYMVTGPGISPPTQVFTFTIGGGGGGGNPFSVNSSPVSNPNFQDSPTVTFSVTGSNIKLSTGEGEFGATPLVANGNFELPTFGLGDQPIPPVGWENLGTDTGTQSYDTVNPAPNKTFSLKVHCNANSTECAMPNSTFTSIIPGQTFTATGYARSDGTAPAAICLEFEQGGASVINDTSKCSFTLSTSWTFLRVTGTSVTGQDYMIVDLADTNNVNSIDGPIAGNMWFDDVQVFPSTTGRMNNIRTVDGVLFGAGVDLGAGINAADTDLGSAPGEIQVFAAPGLSTINITTPVSIKNGHVLRFIQGFATVATAGITVEQGGSILGVEGGIETCTSTPSGTVIFHEFNGDMITYNGGSSGGGGSRGGGSIHNLTLCNDVNTPGDLNGNAIKITGTVVNTNQSSFVDVGRVFTDGSDATKRWTRGLLADGTPIGGINGIRNIWVHDSRFTSSGTNNQDVEFLNCFNCEMTNVMMSNSSNGAQTVGATVSGSSGNISSNTKIVNLDSGTLVLDWASNTTLFGGALSNITVTANAGGQSLLIPGLLVNAPSNSSPSTTQIVWYDLTNTALRTDGNVLLANGKSLQGLTAGAVAKNLIGVSVGGSETLDLNGLGINAGTGNVGITNPNGNLVGIVAALTTTAATSDNVTVTGMTASGHCSLTQTNALAATDAASTYISAKTTNQITVTHPVSAGRTWDITCWPN